MSERADDREMIAATEVARTRPANPPDDLPRTGGAALRLFVAHPSPLLIGAFLLVFGGWRLALGGFSWVDALVALAIVAYFPFNEWLIHVFILHWRPRRLFGRTLDFELSRSHRRHHADPWNLTWVFVPRHVHAWTLLIVAALLWAGWPWKEWVLTGIATYLILGLHYEWVHLLAHIPWCPNIRYYQRRVREHRQHHFRNENYWWGVSMGLGDRVLHTAPAMGDVGRSDTRYDLDSRF